MARDVLLGRLDSNSVTSVTTDGVADVTPKPAPILARTSVTSVTSERNVTARPAMHETRRERDLRWLDENERFDDWLTRCCTKIANGAPPSICWRNYLLRRSTFFDWLLLSPHRAAQVANALSIAQVRLWEKQAATRNANRTVSAEIRREKAYAPI